MDEIKRVDPEEEMTEELLRKRREQRKRKRAGNGFGGSGKKHGKAGISHHLMQRAKRAGPIALIVVILIFFAAAASIKSIISLEIEHRQLLKENKELTEKRDTLKIELKNVNSKEYIEEQARKQLRLVNPDEILFVFNEDENGEKGTEKDGKDG